MAIRATVRSWAAVVSLFVAALSAAACQRPQEAVFAANTADANGAVSPGAPGAQLRPGPNVIGINCDVADCQASCMAGSTILLAYGFHGRTYDAGGPVSSKCGEGVEWLGGCIGQESCSVTTTCKTSAMYLICR